MPKNVNVSAVCRLKKCPKYKCKTCSRRKRQSWVWGLKVSKFISLAHVNEHNKMSTRDVEYKK